MTINDIRKLALNKKEELVKQGKDLEKIDVAIALLKDDMCFFNIDMNIMVPVLLYLGIEEEKVEKVYFELLSFKNYKSFNKVRIVADLDEIGNRNNFK